MATFELKSDVSNDLKQTADQMGTVGKAVAELVWNAVQYQPEGQVANVTVTIRRHKSGTLDEIQIADNGRGMDDQDLRRYFTMHADNLDRQLGNPGRGRFGTGAKAAGMAVADEMVVDTIKDGIRTIVVLRREALISGHSRIPLESRTIRTPRPNGTRITLRRFRIKKFKEEATRGYVQRSLGRFLLTHRVKWNGEPLVYKEPPYVKQWVVSQPDESVGQIGNVKLFLRLSKNWLPREDHGITIMANDIAYESNYLGDHANALYANQIFGHVDVPLLEVEDEEGRPAYTADRTMYLNRENLRVEALLSWINAAVGNIINALEAEERAQQDRARQEGLRKTARTIEEALNRRLAQALENVERRINLKISANPSHAGLSVQQSDVSTTTEVSRGDGDQEFVRDDNSDLRWRDPSEGEGCDINVRENASTSHHAVCGTGNGQDDKDTNGVRDPQGNKGGKSRDTNQGKRKKIQPKGAFRVVPKAMGPDAPRAHYSPSYLTIFVNVNHPQLRATGDEDSPEFKILLAECAASEFALALTEMRIEYGDPDVDPNQWPTIITAIRREESETGAELAQAIRNYRSGASQN